MKTYPHAFNETHRVEATLGLPGLTRDNEAIFDTLCTTAKLLLDCPIAHVSVVGEHTQWYKSVVGIALEEMPKNNSFCTHTIMSDAPMVIPNLSTDPKFAEHPMVVEGGPKARFYAGVPLVLSSGFRFGSLCVLDFEPHEFPSDKEIAILTELGRAVVNALEKAPAEDAVPPKPTCQETFLTLVGHELRTPMTVINGSLRMLETRQQCEIGQKLSMSASRSSDHLSKLITSILNFSDVRTGELQLSEEKTSLSDMFDGIYNDHAIATTEAGKTFLMPECTLSDPILIDRNHLKVCLISLLMNSAMHGGDVLKLSARTDDNGDIEISVFDNGQLDKNANISELYEPFKVGGELLNRSTKGGLGLGLPLTRRIVELHGGEIELSCDDAGTVACIRLPKWRLA